MRQRPSESSFEGGLQAARRASTHCYICKTKLKAGTYVLKGQALKPVSLPLTRTGTERRGRMANKHDNILSLIGNPMNKLKLQEKIILHLPDW